jgi:predicted short-subunit dehydrogenase-like oxidoreductase (DUF2520 family)
VTLWPWKGIGIAGTGNVAWNLGHTLVEKGLPVTQVMGRSEAAAADLAKSVGADEWSVYRPLSADTDICIVAVSDDAISEVISMMHTKGCLFMHTAGSVPMKVFESHADHYGVLYPLQTMSKKQRIDFGSVPILIEANTPANLETIRKLALTLSSRVEEVNSEKRFIFHLAAVIANNFTNHLYYQAEQLLQENGLSFDLLHSLIAETARKAITESPEKAQTGPARRGNRRVIEKHLKMLEDRPALAELYRIISRNIEETSEKLKVKN